MKNSRILTLFLIAIITATAAFAQEDKVRKIDALLKNYHDYGQLNGSVLVSENGRVIYKKGFGMANMEWEIPNQPDTKFRIASVTKQFTAALILQLVDEGKLKLDGKITDYLPDYRKDTGDRVTIHQLLNHTSGIPSYTSLPGFFQNESRNPHSVKDFVKKFASGDLEFEPGTKYSYNNSAYFILGAIIEQLTGKPYAKVLQERIFDPVGMKDSGYDDDSPLIRKRASGYQKTADGYENAPYLEMQIPYAAGSIYSTVEDLYKWDQALYDNKIISEASKKLMFTPGLSNYGYGFNIVDVPVGKTDQKIKLTLHTGGINGFNSYFSRAIEQKHLVVILDNVSQGRYHRNINTAILNILNNQPYDEPKRSIAEALYKISFEKGGAAAIAEYRRLKAGTTSASYDFSESELNTLGYQLLAKERTKDAIEIFKLNVEMFPAASNPYDSLGEAYLKDGNKELALANYKRAVELNPANAGAIQAVRRLEGKEIKLDPAIFDAYVGEYQITPQLVFTVTRDGDKLMGQMGGQGKLELEPVSETQFTVTAVKANISFEKDAAGKVTGLILSQGARSTTAKKVK
jgi:CubicO group peptidase (beta-lactamase class C family)